MAAPSPLQLAARHRLEQALRVAAPALDLLLLAGERLSRAVDRADDEPAPALRHSGAKRLHRPAGAK